MTQKNPPLPIFDRSLTLLLKSSRSPEKTFKASKESDKDHQSLRLRVSIKKTKKKKKTITNSNSHEAVHMPRNKTNDSSKTASENEQLQREEKYLVNSQRAIQNNLVSAQNRFTFLAIVSGAACGIIGCTDLIGLLWFAATTVVCGSLILVVSCEREPKLFVEDSFSVFSSGASAGFASFVLFWTLFYNICHLF
jgi:ER membrane protein complex subunit 6